ncbi:TetR/AcrR family transcriptional regulator [Streptomyces sp. CB01881]|uniref:TetR/AcrR family transcriptional regulator n=1 Tax=Streptomyces sp. CB01881 TaxID=2078691 RepID=UPI000CDCA2F2|nr:TetR/AcrR family transcriptional regulator [Streptomyces sp. CB01881]AUY49538.1 TetR family transcriptional regulator [Streptomyces sp. CB01881]TYC72928.1 TetR family transcriptional regulator [Streptomyces sp. CB01881]
MVKSTGTATPDGLSLRERKKRQTAIRIWRSAIALFAERSFDEVSVAEIAAAAEVSKMTVFNYFPSKEDLVMAPMEQHVDEPARVVRDRAPGTSAVAALRAHFVAALAGFDPATGLNDDRFTIDVVQLIHRTPALALRATTTFSHTANELLAAELLAQDPEGDRVRARAAAAQLLGVRVTLTTENQRRMLAGERAADVLPEAVDNARRAFDLVEHGLGDYGTRTT